MRQPRLKVKDRTAVYHCLSRTVGGQFLLKEVDREMLRRLLWQQAQFCGVQIITHTILSNHFHCQVRVPAPRPLSDAALLRRAQGFYPPKSPLLELLQRTMAEAGALPEDLRQRLLRRMGDVSVFMKELKQRFSRWYNGQHDRFGTLWAERFKSLLVEDCPEAIGLVAAYIDLNAVRAGLVEDPKDYRFCGYGEAVGGHPLARAGLLSFLGTADWDRGGAEYRMRLFVAGATAGQSGKALIDRQRILAVLRAGGQLEWAEALRLRLRYLSDGLVLGSEKWVNERFLEFRQRFGPRRQTGARKLRSLPFASLRTLRDLRKQVIG